MKKLFIINVIWIAALSTLHLSAQKAHQELSVYGGCGLSTLRYKLPSPNSTSFNGDRKAAFGGDFGVGYTYFVGESSSGKWSYAVHSGLEGGLYIAKANVKHGVTIKENQTDKHGVTIEDILKDNEGDQFRLRSTISDYEETQKMWLLSIPVMGMVKIDWFYGMGGFKFGLPVGRKFESAGKNLLNEAEYYDQRAVGIDNWLTAPKFQGYGNFTEWDSYEKIKYNVTVLLSLEAGGRFALSEKYILYAGAYFDYGINNSLNKSYEHLVNYRINHAENVEFNTNSVLSAFTEKVNVMSAGIKIRLAMKL